ncbi:hypothetical protein BGZ76_004271 [Entomortierella beljakovae]|nr:hypothetical protein BGZ76_004271 [Entomortierella beljakovae]
MLQQQQPQIMVPREQLPPPPPPLSQNQSAMSMQQQTSKPFNNLVPPPIVSTNEQSSPSSVIPLLGIPSPIQQNGPEIGGVMTPTPPPFAGYSFPSVDRAPSPNRMSVSDESRAQHVQHIRGASVGSGRASPLPMANMNNNLLKPIPANSEDWGALVDTPASPTFPPNNMVRPFLLNQGQFMTGASGYTDSPSEDINISADYMQHVSQQQQQQHPQMQQPPFRQHAQTDPTPMNQQNVYRQQQHNHHHHNSISGMPVPGSGNMGPVDPRNAGMGNNNNNNINLNPPNNSRHMQRRSWSPNTTESFDPTTPGNSYGRNTPPRRSDGTSSPGHRSGSHSKQNSVATSVSLLNDASTVAKYRDAANRTNDTTLQLSYAKYLLEIGESSQAFASGGASGDGQHSPTSSAPPSGPFSPTDSVNSDGSIGKRQLTQEAIYWIDRLAREGQSEAQYIRGTWYEEGLYGTKKSADKALKYFQSSSKGDYTPAHYKVAYFCEKRKDNNKAIVLYKKASTYNDPQANYRLAMVYLNGELGQSKNMKTGMQYLKRAADFNTESSRVPAYILGLILSREYNQINIPDDVAFPDDGEALECFKRSADLGHGPANFKLGSCYEYGTLGCHVDPFLSVKHYERAVIADDSNGEAEMALSGWYLSGAEGCFEANDGLAFQYASKAVEKGLPKAQYALGYYHEVGISVPTDIHIAMDYYKQAAANGNKDAQARLSDQNKFDKNTFRNSMRRINQAGRSTKDQNCVIM